MFGKPQQRAGGPVNNGQSAPARKAATEVAEIQGGGLVQVIVSSLSPLTYYLFLTEQFVPQFDIESLNIVIEAPGDRSEGMIRATLAKYVTGVNGGRSEQRIELFPCTLEIVAMGRRLCVICPTADSFDGLFVTMGLKANGTDSEVKGIQSLNVLITEGILDAKITWNEGDTESIFPPA